MSANALAALAAALGSVGQSFGQNRELKRRAMLDALNQQEQEENRLFRNRQLDLQQQNVERQDERQNFDIAYKMAASMPEGGRAVPPGAEPYLEGAGSIFTGQFPTGGGIDATPPSVGQDPFSSPPPGFVAAPIESERRLFPPDSEKLKMKEMDVLSKREQFIRRSEDYARLRELREKAIASQERIAQARLKLQDKIAIMKDGNEKRSLQNQERSLGIQQSRLNQEIFEFDTMLGEKEADRKVRIHAIESANYRDENESGGSGGITIYGAGGVAPTATPPAAAKPTATRPTPPSSKAAPRVPSKKYEIIK